MEFTTIVFHEVLAKNELKANTPRPIQVADNYQDQLPKPLYLSVDKFQQNMNYLKEADFHILTLPEVKAFYQNEFELPPHSVLLTFDDCYQSLKTTVYPILRSLNFQAVAFAPTGWLFETAEPIQTSVSRTLSFSEMEQMNDIFTTANHTHHFHQRKGREMARSMWSTTAEFKNDLLKCNHWVTETDVFAYPFGLYNQENITTLTNLKFSLAFTTIPGKNRLTTPTLELHRNIVSENMSLQDFKKLVD